jgi:hypothetical protein
VQLPQRFDDGLGGADKHMAPKAPITLNEGGEAAYQLQDSRVQLPQRFDDGLGGADKHVLNALTQRFFNDFTGLVQKARLRDEVRCLVCILLCSVT